MNLCCVPQREKATAKQAGKAAVQPLLTLLAHPITQSAVDIAELHVSAHSVASQRELTRVAAAWVIHFACTPLCDVWETCGVYLSLLLLSQ